MRLFVFAALAALLCLAAPETSRGQSSPAPAAAAAPPQWWADHVNFITRDGGVWVTPNAATDAAGPDAYAMEWRTANEGRVLSGRLYGLREGREIAEYWTFREFWHPGENRAVVLQWGGPGVFGVGESRWEAGVGVLDQTFWLPDGRMWREGHRNRELGDQYETQAFDIDALGNWTLNDRRIWRRLPLATP